MGDIHAIELDMFDRLDRVMAKGQQLRASRDVLRTALVELTVAVQMYAMLAPGMAEAWQPLIDKADAALAFSKDV
jgi:hypothetical protein